MQCRYLLVGALTLLSGPVCGHEKAAATAPRDAATTAPVHAPVDTSQGGVARPGEADAARPDRGLGLVLAKTATYEVGTSMLETGMLAAFFGGTAGGAGGAFVAVLATTSAVYLVHEFAWRAATQEETRPDDAGLVAYKSLTYRVADTMRAYTIGAALGGAQMAASAVYLATLTAAELGLYATNEVAFAQLQQ